MNCDDCNHKLVPDGGWCYMFSTKPATCNIFEYGSHEKNLLAFLDSAGQGCISGRVNEWPQLVKACRFAFDEITKLRKETKP